MFFLKSAAFAASKTMEVLVTVGMLLLLVPGWTVNFIAPKSWAMEKINSAFDGLMKLPDQFEIKMVQKLIPNLNKRLRKVGMVELQFSKEAQAFLDHYYCPKITSSLKRNSSHTEATPPTMETIAFIEKRLVEQEKAHRIIASLNPRLERLGCAPFPYLEGRGFFDPRDLSSRGVDPLQARLAAEKVGHAEEWESVVLQLLLIQTRTLLLEKYIQHGENLAKFDPLDYCGSERLEQLNESLKIKEGLHKENLVHNPGEKIKLLTPDMSLTMSFYVGGTFLKSEYYRRETTVGELNTHRKAVGLPPVVFSASGESFTVYGVEFPCAHTPLNYLWEETVAKENLDRLWPQLEALNPRREALGLPKIRRIGNKGVTVCEEHYWHRFSGLNPAALLKLVEETDQAETAVTAGQTVVPLRYREHSSADRWHFLFSKDNCHGPIGGSIFPHREYESQTGTRWNED